MAVGGSMALSGVVAIGYAAILSRAVTYEYTQYAYSFLNTMYAIGGFLLFVGAIPFLWGLLGLVSSGKGSSATTPVSPPTAKISGGTGGWEERSKCGICGMPVTAYKVKIDGMSAKVKAVCPRRHKWEFWLPLSQQPEWIGVLTSHIFRCKKCSTQLLYPEKTSFHGGYAEFKLRCPACGSSHRSVTMPLYNAVEDARQLLVTRTREK